LGIEDPFHLTPDQMQKIKEKLIKLKGNVLSFYTTPDEALQLYKNNGADLGQLRPAANEGDEGRGANIAYVNPKEGALAWLDTWAMTSGVRDTGLAEAWVN